MNTDPSFRLSTLASAIRQLHRPQAQARRAKLPSFPQVLTVDQMGVAKLACDLALDHMEANGNVIGEAQGTVLLGLLKLYCEMLFGHLKGRFGVPVPTGYGKTTSAAALIVALHKAKVTDRPLAVAASRVEALCDLRADIDVIARRAGCLEGLADKIGMHHSYSDAVFPPTEGNERRQFLLVTQAQLSASSKAETVLAHESGADRLVIWDESLLPSSVFAIDLQEAFGGAAAVLSDATFHAAVSEAAAWFTDAQDRLLSAQSIDATEGAVISLPPIDDEKHKRLRSSIASHRYSDVLLPLLDMAGGKVRVNPRRNAEGSKGAVVTFRVSVPDSLERIVILDASFPINRLYEVDRRVTPWTESPSVRHLAGELDLQHLKDYSQVTIRHMRRGGGRSSVENDLVRGGGKLMADVVRLIDEVPSDESVLIFTFKHRGRSADLPAALRASLKKGGVDLDAKVPVGKDGQLRSRINIATWGQECGTNAFAHCKHVILLGVLRLSFGELLGRYLAASENLGAAYPKTTEEEVMLGHLGHSIYQAASRGASRSTDAQGNAGEMNLWLVEADPRIREEIEKVMPGCHWGDWQGDYSRAKADPKAKLSPKTDSAFAAAVEYLEGIPQDVVEVSTATALRSIRQNSDVTKKVWRAVRERFIESPVRGWMVAPNGSRSFIRTSAIHSAEIETALALFENEDDEALAAEQ
ncbi:MAG: hypothetical protein KJ011_05040 [Burkholderiaceae bacterium]|nr:hypothetical protein [Burkholderiaceae bacterium]